MRLIDANAVIDAIKDYGRNAIDAHRKMLGPVDDIISIIDIVVDAPFIEMGWWVNANKQLPNTDELVLVIVSGISTHAPLARCDRNILYILAVSSPMLEVGQNFLSKFLYIYIIKTPFPRRTYGLFSITYPSPIYFCNTNASANK